MCEQQPLDAFEDGVSAAGQEGGQVRVDLGAQLSAMFPALQLDAGGETWVSISLASASSQRCQRFAGQLTPAGWR